MSLMSLGKGIASAPLKLGSAIAFGVCALLLIPTLVGSLFVNAGMLAYRDANFQVCSNCRATDDAARLLSTAVAIDGYVADWRYLYGLALKLGGNLSDARRELESAAQMRPADSRIWASLADVYDGLGLPELAVGAYARGGEFSSLSRHLVNRMQWAEMQMANGNFADAHNNLEQAIQFVPNTLWAWTQLAQPELGASQEASHHVTKYQIPPMQDEREGEYLALAVTQLLRQGTWAPRDAANVIQLLLAYGWSDSAQMILSTMEQVTSDTSEVERYRAEITASAQTTDPMVSTVVQSSTQQHGVALLRDQIAAMLDVEVSQLTLGADVMSNGTFDQPDPEHPWLPDTWLLGTWDGYQHDRAAFSTLLDARAGSTDRSLLIQGFWREPTELPSLGYSEVIAVPASIPPGGLYALNFRYKTDNLDGKILVWDGSIESPTFPQTFLDASQNQWTEVIILGRNAGSVPVDARAVLRLWGTGSVWFDDVQMRSVVAPADVMPVRQIQLR